MRAGWQVWCCIHERKVGYGLAMSRGMVSYFNLTSLMVRDHTGMDNERYLTLNYNVTYGRHLQIFYFVAFMGASPHCMGARPPFKL